MDIDDGIKRRAAHRVIGWGRILASAALLVSAAAMTGWLTRSALLVQVFDVFAPMQFNTALGIALCALAALFRRRGVSAAACWLAGLLGLASFAQDVMGWDLGIDTLFVDPWTTVRSSHPGRMAPNTAIAMTFAAGAQLTLQVLRKRVLASILGTMVASLGAVALIGYASEYGPAYGWAGLTDMAVNTALCWLLIGLATVYDAMGGRTRRFGRAAREPLLAGMLCSLAFVIHSVALGSLTSGREERLRGVIEAEARAAVQHIEDALLQSAANMQRALGQIARTAPEGTALDEVIAQQLVELAPALQTVARESSAGVVPLHTRARDGTDNATTRLESLQRDADAVTLAPGIELLTRAGAAALRVDAGTPEPGALHLLASVDLDELTASAKRLLMPGLSMQLVLPDQPAVDREESRWHLADEWGTRASTSWASAPWSVELVPSLEWLDSQRSRIPERLMLIGATTAVLCAFFSRKWVHVLRATRHANASAASLATEMCKHREARRELALKHEALLERERRLALALRAGEIGSWHWDLRTNEISIDDRLERMLDAVPGTLNGPPHMWSSLVPPASREPLREAAAECRLGHPPTSLDFRLITSTGQSRDLTVRGAVSRDDSDGVAAVVGVAIDITRRLRVERELARSNSDLEEFAFAASHDLQEPLRMVSSFCELVQERYRDAIDEDGQRFLGYAVEGAHRMQRLVADLLSLSLVGRTETPRQLVDTARTCEDVLRDLDNLLQDESATVTVGEMPVVYAYPSEIERLLRNLVINAARHGGTSPAIEIGAETRGTEQVIFVRDDGPGIDPRYHTSIFRAFKRVAQRSAHSSGIGLALCRKIAEHHDGRVWVESSLGEGATFFVALPILPAGWTPPTVTHDADEPTSSDADGTAVNGAP